MFLRTYFYGITFPKEYIASTSRNVPFSKYNYQTSVKDYRILPTAITFKKENKI